MGGTARHQLDLDPGADHHLFLLAGFRHARRRLPGPLAHEGGAAMRILIVGGVFARDERYRRSINPTPEITLEAGLRRRGVDVVVAPHKWSHSLRGIDVVHVHHLAKSVVGLAGCRVVRPTPLVFTRHGEERALSVKQTAAL